jgi:hypothetical protein
MIKQKLNFVKHLKENFELIIPRIFSIILLSEKNHCSDEIFL